MEIVVIVEMSISTKTPLTATRPAPEITQSFVEMPGLTASTQCVQRERMEVIVIKLAVTVVREADVLYLPVNAFKINMIHPSSSAALKRGLQQMARITTTTISFVFHITCPCWTTQ